MTLAKWERISEWPMMAMSVAFIAVYAWQVLAEPTGAVRRASELAMNLLWLAFAIEYLVSLMLAERKVDWFKRHLFDLAVVVLPMVRPLRLVRLLTALTALHRTGGMALRGRIALYAFVSVIMLLFVGSLAVFEAERYAPGASITTYADAAWWAFVTITTVGYGEFSPVTVTGRMIAFCLMLAGIALIGVVTATLASWIIDSVGAEDRKEERITRDHVEALASRLDRIEADIAALAAAAGERASVDGGVDSAGVGAPASPAGRSRSDD